MLKKVVNLFGKKVTAEQERLEKNVEPNTKKLASTPSETYEWTVPELICPKLLPVHEFSMKYLPENLSPYVFNTALRINNAPPEFVAVSCLISLAALIGNSAVVQPKKLDSGWTVVPTLWGMLVGEPSTKKSPCMDAGINLLTGLERGLFKTSEKARKLIVNDTTPEALAILLAGNPKGVLVSRDELASWLINLDQDQKAYERGFYLQAFNGSSSFTQQRVTRESITIDPLILSMIGGIQPSRLNPLLSSREQGKCNDGLFERFQLLIMPDQNGEYVDIPPDVKAIQEAEQLFNAIARFTINNDRTLFTFSLESSSFFDEYSKVTIEREQTSEPLMQAILGKYPTLCAKLALIFHLCEQVSTGDIDSVSSVIQADSIKRALLWMSLLESHNARVQSLISQTKRTNSSEMLVARLTKLKSPFTFRDLERKNWKYLTTKEEREEAVLTLCKYGFLKDEIKDGEPKPQSRYYIHPEYS